MADLQVELAVLLAIAIVGPACFAPFEVETPGHRKVFKWAAVVGVTIGLHAVAGHWAVAFPIVAGLAGVTFHWTWCRRSGIDPVRATPRRRYYELRGWPWVE